MKGLWLALSWNIQSFPPGISGSLSLEYAEKVQYPELKEMIEKSEVFMRTKQNATIRFELPDNHRQYEAE